MKKRKTCVIVILGILLSGMIGTKLFHEVQISKEEKELLAYGSGNFIDIDGRKINCVIGGKKDEAETIVFMHGLGMGDTSISTEPMLSYLKERYRTCVIDRYGNGMSDDTDKAQTVDVILEEYRKTLSAQGLEGPYIIVAHSIAGMYANYWGNQYPEEIKAIVYLDADPAEWYAGAGKPKSMQVFQGKLQQIAASTGIQRFIMSDEMLIGQDEGHNFTEQQNKLRKSLIFRNTYSKATQSEFENYYRNATCVIENGVSLSMPQLYIQAVSKNSNPDYLDEKKKIMEERGDVSVIRISGTHCLYEVAPAETADAILRFLGEMDE